MHRFVLIFEADRCSDRTQTSQYLKKRGNIVFVTLRDGMRKVCAEQRGGSV